MSEIQTGTMCLYLDGLLQGYRQEARKDEVLRDYVPKHEDMVSAIIARLTAHDALKASLRKETDKQLVEIGGLVQERDALKAEVDGLREAEKRAVHRWYKEWARAEKAEQLKASSTYDPNYQDEDGDPTGFRPPPPGLSPEDERALRAKAEYAYCEYVRISSRYECCGEDQKMKEGSFGKAELNAHRLAREYLGQHRAYMDALDLRSRLAEGSPKAAPPLPERIKELMVMVCHWQINQDTKRCPRTEQDQKAFGEVLRILQDYGSEPAPPGKSINNTFRAFPFALSPEQIKAEYEKGLEEWERSVVAPLKKPAPPASVEAKPVTVSGEGKKP